MSKQDRQPPRTVADLNRKVRDNINRNEGDKAVEMINASDAVLKLIADRLVMSNKKPVILAEGSMQRIDLLHFNIYGGGEYSLSILVEFEESGEWRYVTTEISPVNKG